MGETRVDQPHLLEDLRDAYPGSLEETIVTEIVATALDSKASVVAFRTDTRQATLTVVDDGTGMMRKALRSYHDLAATTKRRGHGIGFAGVGIKLGLLACDEVITETRRGKTHIASTWRLSSKRRAPWKWIPPPGLVAERGTAVRLKLPDALSPLLDAGFLDVVLRRHFEPLFDPTFDAVLEPHYPSGVRFMVNGRVLPQRAAPGARAPLAIRVGRRRKPSAVGYLTRSVAPPGEDRRGIAVSTLGKVIKRGWDWLGVSPGSPNEVSGLIEVPALAECLTLSKADFIRTGPRGALYLTHRKAIQQAVAAQLAEWGEPWVGGENKRRRKARTLERDLESVLVNLADDYPLLASLVERHRGGQRRLPIGDPGKGAMIVAGPLDAGAEAGGFDASATTAPPSEARQPAVEPPEAEAVKAALPGGRGPKRPARYALSIRFESRPDDPELGRLLESTVWVNDAHPAYARAAASHHEPYHIALTVALTLAPLAVEAKHVHGFVTAFLTRWGEAVGAKKRPKRKRPRV
jgi:hypothetical protein